MKGRGQLGQVGQAGFAIPARPCSAFTLIEIMVAVTIFGILTLAVYSTFRIGLKSYESGRQQMEINQTARAVFDLIARDLRALYYLTPREYNQDLVGVQRQRDLLKMQQGGHLTPGRAPAAQKEKDKEEQPLPGIPIDLTIVGVDGGDLDSLTFVYKQTDWGGTTPVEPWALARVKYFVENGILFRSEGPVFVEKIPKFQHQPIFVASGGTAAPPGLLEPEPAQTAEEADEYLKDQPREMVARNVLAFDLRYGYWTDEGWFEAPEWIAHERRFRNAPTEIDPNDPNAMFLRIREMNRPTDDIPAYISMTLTLGYGQDGSRTRIFRSRFRLMVSSETFEPMPSALPRIGDFPPGMFPQLTPFGASPGIRR
ncbi:MAG: prepilin-type N-terminal cleavage/methylation domain-containing protein [Candidatus Sumerlaeia bacterium]|nr:prepilin-type N-terminal cleavage/methylation domain-containing protein [Candidatus Sumerlaeia bacterium]